jgi:hypothetical protein
MRARAVTAAAITLLALSLHGPVAAQNGTPAAGGQASTSCSDLQPRDAAFFQQIPGTPAAELAKTETTGTPTPFTMPEGNPADQATVDEIAALYQQLTDCLNKGDYLRAYALYTDEYLQKNLSAKAIESLAATPVPIEASRQSRFQSVLDARMLANGQIGALVSTTNAVSGQIIIYSVLQRVGDHLRINEEQVVEVALPTSPEAGSAATPAA